MSDETPTDPIPETQVGCPDPALHTEIEREKVAVQRSTNLDLLLQLSTFFLNRALNAPASNDAIALASMGATLRQIYEDVRSRP